MNYRFFVVCLLIAAVSSQLYAEKKESWDERNRDQAWFEKKLKAAENIDKFITALLLGSGASYGISKNSSLKTVANHINPVPVRLRQYNPQLLAGLLAAKLGITLRRMHLHDRYVGFDLFKLLPSMIYFMVVDMASWGLKKN